MTARITADWLRAPALQAVFDALETDGDEARVVGGAVRNTLLGLPATDIDISTTAVPSTVMGKAAAHGLKAVPTGFDHGTVTLVCDGIPYEVTTLREDVETHGRSATVRFGRNWLHDAERRDFTMNALYCDRRGEVFDPVGGLPDVEARHVRFIGDPRLRIAEDYLRILRFFRFHAQYGAGDLDAAGFAAVVDLRDGLAGLSAERIGMEMRKLVSAPRAPETVLAMREAGIVSRVLATHGGLRPFQDLRALDALAPETRAPALALAVLSDGGEADLDDMADHLRLSNAERKRMKVARCASDIPRGWDEARPAPVAKTEILRLLFLAGREAAIDGLLHAWANAGVGPEDELFADALTLLRDAEIPVFPLTGKDLVSTGVPAGPAVGEGLQKARAAWIDSGFALDREALVAVATGA